MSYDHIVVKIEGLQAEVDAMLAEAEATDQAEDEAFGEDRRGDEVAPELARRESRLKKLYEAKEAIEAEAREKAEASARARAEAAGAREEEINAAGKAAAEKAKPKPSAQRNFTDPESRMMKTNHGFAYAFNAQAVVDEKHQVVLAEEVTQEAGDVNQLLPMIEKVKENLAKAGIWRSAKTLLADAGYSQRTTSGRPRAFAPMSFVRPDGPSTARSSKRPRADQSQRTRRDERRWPESSGRKRAATTTRAERRSSSRPSDR